jgi:phenylacetate-CoA ligase
VSALATKLAPERMLARLPDRAMAATTRGHRMLKREFWAEVRRWRAQIETTDRWPSDRLEQHGLESLRDLLVHARDHVPYYRQAFGELDWRPEELDDPARISDLPQLSKADLQEHLEELVARDFPRERLEYSTTGGSTGVPVGFYLDKNDSLAAEWAFMTALWSRVGYSDGDRCAILGGEPPAGGRLWDRRPFWNFLVLSSYHLTDEYLPQLVARLRAFRPAFIKGYPSSCHLVARWLLETGESPPAGLRAVLCGSENLYDWQREEIAQAFGCRVFGWYGQSERVCLAGECESRHELHIFPQYGHTELVDSGGRPIEEAGVPGEVVATPYVTRSMPLIRFRTGDIAVLADGPCPDCGRHYRRFERIEGRAQEFIITADGRPISMTAVNMHSRVFDNVRQFRFVQEEPGRLLLRLVPAPAWDSVRDPEAIRSELAPKLRDVELIGIEEVTEIPPTRSGKQRFLDQHLSIGFGDQT